MVATDDFKVHLAVMVVDASHVKIKSMHAQSKATLSLWLQWQDTGLSGHIDMHERGVHDFPEFKRCEMTSFEVSRPDKKETLCSEIPEKQLRWLGHVERKEYNWLYHAEHYIATSRERGALDGQYERRLENQEFEHQNCNRFDKKQNKMENSRTNPSSA